MEIGAKNTQNTGGVVVRVTNLQMAGITQGDTVTCKTGRGIFVHRTNSFPEWRENPYIGNQEMSDKSRNRL